MEHDDPGQRSTFMSNEGFEKLRDFSSANETPFIVIDLEKISERYDELTKALPKAKIYYAVKANPHDDVLATLHNKGSHFDVASIYEIDKVLGLGVPPDRLSYGNTIKKEKDIAYAYGKGIRLYTSDSDSDVEKLAKHAPGSRVMFRLLLDCKGADWPLSRKFGAHPDKVFNLILKARDLGLIPYGISFHVGSQQRDVGQWDSAIALCRYLFDALKKEGVTLGALNLGGGLPAHYLRPTPETAEYMASIKRYLEEDFPRENIDIILEPGRSIAGDAGVIVSEVVLVSKKSDTNDARWVYLDVGKFNGMIETLDETIKYPIIVEQERAGDVEVSEVVLAGPTCDSCDILYENFKYKLPDDLKECERIYVCSTGAYTSSYSSVAFNGFPPIKTYILNGFLKKRKE